MTRPRGSSTTAKAGDVAKGQDVAGYLGDVEAVYFWMVSWLKKTWLKLLADVHVKTWQGGDMQIQTSCSGQNWSNIMADHGIFYCQICLLWKISTHVVHFALCPKLDPRFIRFHEFHATTIAWYPQKKGWTMNTWDGLLRKATNWSLSPPLDTIALNL